MKKSLIPAAILLSLAGAAHADLTIYGLLDVGVGKSIYQDTLDKKTDFYSGGDNGNSEGNSTSRFGLKGSTDVGSGIKANFNLQSNGITSGGAVNDPFFGRQAWFGLSGAFGEVRLGRQDSVPFQTMVGYDFNGASNGVSALFFTFAAPWAPGRQDRSLQYILPNLGGLTAQVGYQPKGNVTDAKDVVSAGVTFAAGPFSVSGAVETKHFNTSKDFYSVAASYDLSVVKFMVGYADGGKVASGGSGKGFSAGVTAPVAGFNIGMMFSQNDDDAIDATAYEFFINKEVLKNTYLYFEAGTAENKLFPVAFGGKDKGTGYALGVIYTF